MKRIGALCGAVALVLMNQAAPAQAALERRIAFDLAPQPLAQALSSFAEQSNLRLVLNTDDVRGLVSKRISGKYTPRAALQLLLASSTLKYEFVDDRTVEIRSGTRAESASGRDEGAPVLDRTSWTADEP